MALLKMFINHVTKGYNWVLWKLVQPKTVSRGNLKPPEILKNIIAKYAIFKYTIPLSGQIKYKPNSCILQFVYL